jgi:translation elongation factor EF-Tu-like GTPase
MANIGYAPSTGTITSVNDTNTSVTILAANRNRKGAAIFNDSTADLYLALADVTASTTNFSVKLGPGDYFELPVGLDGTVYQGVIRGIWASDAAGAARVTELT